MGANGSSVETHGLSTSKDNLAKGGGEREREREQLTTGDIARSDLEEGLGLDPYFIQEPLQTF